MPVLLIRGEHDTTSTAIDAQRLLAAIASPVKHYRVIAPGSHFLCIERNCARLYHELNDFLAPDLRPPSWPPSCGASQWPGTKGNLS